MQLITTNYTTYDLAYYYADLKHVPRLTDEGRRHLITSNPTICPQNEVAQLKHHLIESYLHFAKRIALDLCPPLHYHRSLPDLIAEANFTVTEVIMRTDLSTINDLTSYLAAWIRGRLKRAITNDGVVTVNRSTHARAKEQWAIEQMSALNHLLSLDQLMEWFDTDDLEEPVARPITPTDAAPARDPQERAQVETYLSYLSPRAQAILRLRYGLDDENERRHTTSEIARILGVGRKSILTTERDAIRRLRALGEGKATIGKRNGRACICYAEMYSCLITPEQETALANTYAQLQAQGHAVSARMLAKTAGVSALLASTFLRTHQAEPPQLARARQRRLRLEEAYTRLQAQGKTFGSAILAREAKVGKPAAIDFLEEQRSTSYAAR